MVDGAWTPVPENTIIEVLAPDSGAHVYAHKGLLFCVILPPESLARGYLPVPRTA